MSRLAPHSLAVLFLDFDAFKAVYEHARASSVGDLLLKSIAAKLFVTYLPVTDRVARLGGDEFAISPEYRVLLHSRPHRFRSRKRSSRSLVMRTVSMETDVMEGASVDILVACPGEMNTESFLKSADLGDVQRQIRRARHLSESSGPANG